MTKEADRWFNFSLGGSSQFVIHRKLSLINGYNVKWIFGQHTVTFNYGQTVSLSDKFLSLYQAFQRQLLHRNRGYQYILNLHQFLALQSGEQFNTNQGGCIRVTYHSTNACCYSVAVTSLLILSWVTQDPKHFQLNGRWQYAGSIRDRGSALQWFETTMPIFSNRNKYVAKDIMSSNYQVTPVLIMHLDE